MNRNEYRSQLGQELEVDKIFKGKLNGLYVDIGAYDGITFSNTAFFEFERNWKGLLFEPIPEIFQRCKANRPNSISINAAVTDFNGYDKFIVADVVQDHLMLSGIKKNLDPRHIDRINKTAKKENKEIDVKTYKLSTVLNSFPIFNIDYLSIDTEGSEKDILNSIDFKKFHIKVISVENNYQDESQRKILYHNGFILHKIFGGYDELWINSK